MTKTNAMRLLEQAKIDFTAEEYAFDENDLDGRHAADALGLEYSQVFKTLVAKDPKKRILVFCIPVDRGLDLKKAAQAAGSKSVEMLQLRELLPTTGYIRGGCSPIGMKKKFPTFIDSSALSQKLIAVSAGARGVQILLSPSDLAGLVGAEFRELCTQLPL
ncbi:MAG: Cys-tRNA(Pro) deacylase [Clostridia bacterium]|nr:Cys-tRNA(Pro) deacylase [Clostridia bacterium]